MFYCRRIYFPCRVVRSWAFPSMFICSFFAVFLDDTSWQGFFWFQLYYSFEHKEIENMKQRRKSSASFDGVDSATLLLGLRSSLNMPPKLRRDYFFGKAWNKSKKYLMCCSGFFYKRETPATYVFCMRRNIRPQPLQRLQLCEIPQEDVSGHKIAERALGWA